MAVLDINNGGSLVGVWGDPNAGNGAQGFLITTVPEPGVLALLFVSSLAGEQISFDEELLFRHTTDISLPTWQGDIVVIASHRRKYISNKE